MTTTTKTIKWEKDGLVWRSADGRFYISKDMGGKWHLTDKATEKHDVCVMLRSAKRTAAWRVRDEGRPLIEIL
jgi:hypothetical protein